MKYRIILEGVPATRSAPALQRGYYGPHRGTINGYIYGRVPRERAFQYDKWQAIRTIMDMRHYGYSCCAEPPITVTF